MSQSVSLDDKPTIEGWYGLVFVADDGGGRLDIWADTEYWTGTKWRYEFTCGGERSVERFDTESQAKAWAREEAVKF